MYSSMSGEKSKNDIAVSFKTTGATTTVAPNTIQLRRHNAQNFLLIWLDASIDQSNNDFQNTFTQLKNVVNDLKIFTQTDECVDFLTDVEDIEIVFIIEGTLGQKIIPLIHDFPQLGAVYLFCNNRSVYQQWTKEWNKIKGIHTEITPICEELQMLVKRYNQDSISISFVAASENIFNENLDQLEPSFMYTQIFKEILLEIKHNEQSIKNFTAYCQKGDYGSPINIIRFDNEYHANSAIWWYTFPSFIYCMLNCALRNLEAGIIINMGFFIHDLHHQIKELHQQQISRYHEKSIIVYRGQGLSITDFEKICKTKGGLISFNNFLSTSTNQEVSLGYAMIALTKPDTIGVLFQMSIDTSVSSAPFAAIQEVSYFHEEEEILFSMHTVFRIREITRMDNNNPLYQVELELTSDDDQQLRTLTERIREDTAGHTDWMRLGNLLLKIGHFGKAEELYKVLLEHTFDESEKAIYYDQLSYIKDEQCDYEKAIWYYEKALDIKEKILPINHPSLTVSHNNIGLVYESMGEYSKAVLSHEKALQINEKTLPPNDPILSISYQNIGEVYRYIGEYSKALSFYEKAFTIRQKTLPSNHPLLANSYNNIGLVYKSMGEYSKAFLFLEKALEIKKKTLPSNHHSLATSYNNIGLVYGSIEDYPKQLSFYEKSLEIYEKIFPPNHSSLATSYNNIAAAYDAMREYSKALSSYQKALEICVKSLSLNHPVSATSYNNIGWVFRSTGNYSKALSYYESALDILQYSLPANHIKIQSVRQTIEIVKQKLLNDI